MSKKGLLPVGIDDMAFYVPKLYLPIKTLAAERNIQPEKLENGLGLKKMALPDVHEDSATMAAEAILEIIERNNLDPRKIGRIYLGTESALDMAKPTATYSVGMVSEKLADRFGKNCFQNCDVLDMTFACAGAADALQNCLDWAATDPENIAIVVSSDVAKYELESTGEYTQGAGAVAVLIKWKPRLLAFRRFFGVGMENVHDFFKPRRERFSETPIFDGQFSNLCYRNRMMEAIEDFRKKCVRAGVFGEGQFKALSERWARLIFHLPYSFHGKRMFVEQFILERKMKGAWTADLKKYGFAEPHETQFSDKKSFEKTLAGFQKNVSESPVYQRFVAEKLEKAQRASSEVGNLYTASIFLALMSTLESDFVENSDLAGKKFGFVAYGSGSKSKVFEAIVQPNWRDAAAHFQVFQKLENRLEISYQDYLDLHNHDRKTSILLEKGRFRLEKIGTEGNLLGARFYGFG